MAVAKGATKADAYRQNYKTEGWGAQAVAEAAAKTATKSNIAARIAELTEVSVSKASEEFSIDVRKLLETFFHVAFTNANELTRVTTGACRHCWSVGGAYHWKEREYEEALRGWQRDHERWSKRDGKPEDEPPCPDASGGLDYRFTAEPNPHCRECEGDGVERMRTMDTTKLSPGALHLYRGAQPTAFGHKILFGDKDKALDSIGRMLGAFDDRLRVDLKGQVASLQLTTNDPKEAAMAYERMITGNG